MLKKCIHILYNVYANSEELKKEGKLLSKFYYKLWRKTIKYISKQVGEKTLPAALAGAYSKTIKTLRECKNNGIVLFSWVLESIHIYVYIEYLVLSKQLHEHNVQHDDGVPELSRISQKMIFIKIFIFTSNSTLSYHVHKILDEFL